MKAIDANAAEIEAFREQLARKAMIVNTAQLSLMERVREFIAAHGGNGTKIGRPDYVKMVGLDEIERIRVALREYDRVRAIPASDFATTSPATGAEGEG